MGDSVMTVIAIFLSAILHKNILYCSAKSNIANKLKGIAHDKKETQDHWRSGCRSK